jgi:AraC-like DNA-binding protein
MSILYEERASDSPYVERIMRGWTVSDGSPIRPAEVHWHLVFVRVKGKALPLVVGPWSTAGVVSYFEGAEILWIKFKLGTFMPHLPTGDIRDQETSLPGASSQSFWLNSCAWQFPDYENADTFVDRLVREDVLVRDPLVKEVVEGQLQEDISSRTLRYRFARATGLSKNHIYQFERAQQAAALLAQGVPILDTVFEAGYYDQPHLTRSMKRFIGHTPGQLAGTGAPQTGQRIRTDVPE